MSDEITKPASQKYKKPSRLPTQGSPFISAPEGASVIFMVTMLAACGPLTAGVVLHGWRALYVAAISIISCGVIEGLYYRVTRVPALLGRSHGYLTGVLLALTLPPFVPWYVPVVAAAFAIIVGKAIFGGVGHFLWQPALVGRLAVAVIFSGPIFGEVVNPQFWPVLAQEKVLSGDIRNSRTVEDFSQWQGAPAPIGADAFKVLRVTDTLGGLTRSEEPVYSALAYTPKDVPRAQPTLLSKLPPISDLFYGGRAGGIGETCAIVIIISGLYLMYRNYIKWQLPLAFVAAAAMVAAIAPITLAGPGRTPITHWLPYVIEGKDVGFAYVSYQILGGQVLLAAFFMATEMTSRPVTASGQAIFGLGAGALAMILQLYIDAPIPAYMAVLAMNTLTPTIDSVVRPRVLGRPKLSMTRPIVGLWRSVRATVRKTRSD